MSPTGHSTSAAFSLAAVVLCGGESKRMGRPKASLPFGNQTMLQRVVSQLDSVCNPIVVVAAANQTVPDVTCQQAHVHVVRDEQPARGPLQGLISGLRLLRQNGASDQQLAFASSCDVPLLEPAWPARLVELIGDADVAVPFDESYHHPLASVYRLRVLDTLEVLNDADELRPRMLFDRVDTVRVPVEQMRAVDPDLRTLANLNTPEDYSRVLEQSGLSPG